MTTYRGSNSAFRAKVYRRDKGVCVCGLDTEALTAKYRDAEDRDRATARGTFRCLNQDCEHVGNTRPCEACGSRFQQTFECYEARAAVTEEARRHGFKPLEFVAHMKSRKAIWIADHIVPVADGGDDSLDNGRTLCLPCNHSVTGEQNRQRNRAKARARTPKNEARAIVRAMRGDR